MTNATGRAGPGPWNVEPELIEVIRSQFVLDWEGDHGIRHWERVRENGLRLAPATGANVWVVELFALFHDSRRENEWDDPEHGKRAAEFLVTLNGRGFSASDEELALLTVACREHTHARTHEDVTVRTCLDADRLDLGRVGIRPNPRRLCTEAARDPQLLEWAYARSLGG